MVFGICQVDLTCRGHLLWWPPPSLSTEWKITSWRHFSLDRSALRTASQPQPLCPLLGARGSICHLSPIMGIEILSPDCDLGPGRDELCMICRGKHCFIHHSYFINSLNYKAVLTGNEFPIGPNSSRGQCRGRIVLPLQEMLLSSFWGYSSRGAISGLSGPQG